MANKKPGGGRLAENRRARHDYEFLERYEAGLVLLGSEVKSLRDGKVTFKDGYIRIKDGEAWLVGVHIAPYANAGPVGHGGHDPERPRKLLLHHREIAELMRHIEQKGLTVVPVALYLHHGKIKLEIAVGRGRKLHDQRQALKDKAVARDTRRELTRSGKER